MKKVFYIILITLLLLGCGGPTKVTYQELPKDQPLAVNIDGVTLRIVSYGYTKDWTELEIAVLNETDKEIHFDTGQVYLANEKGYDLIPFKAHEIDERVYRKTGKWITPLTVGAITAGIVSIVATSSKDRTNLGRAALALAGVAGASELAKRQSAETDIYRKEDLSMKTYNIPPHLQLGGLLYYRATTGIKGIKAFIKIKGQEEFFHIRL